MGAVGEEHRRSAGGLERLVFFSDAVFAIAITLLAIDVRLPPLPERATSDTVLEAIRGVAPEVFAFTISFVVIAAFWLGHYRTFRHVAHVDGAAHRGGSAARAGDGASTGQGGVSAARG